MNTHALTSDAPLSVYRRRCPSLLLSPPPTAMVERFPGDDAAANGFGRRHLHEDEMRFLYEADYPAPPDMRVSAAWRRPGAARAHRSRSARRNR